MTENQTPAPKIEVKEQDGGYRVQLSNNLKWQVARKGQSFWYVVIESYSLDGLLESMNEMSPAYWMVKKLLAKQERENRKAQDALNS